MNLEVQWQNIKKYVLDTMRYLAGEVERRESRPWITQDVISKLDERMKWKNVRKKKERTTTEN
jgi:hypothetical protein